MEPLAANNSILKQNWKDQKFSISSVFCAKQCRSLLGMQSLESEKQWASFSILSHQCLCWLSSAACHFTEGWQVLWKCLLSGDPLLTSYLHYNEHHVEITLFSTWCGVIAEALPLNNDFNSALLHVIICWCIAQRPLLQERLALWWCHSTYCKKKLSHTHFIIDF